MIRNIVLLVCLVLMSSLVFAVGQGSNDTGTGSDAVGADQGSDAAGADQGSNNSNEETGSANTSQGQPVTTAVQTNNQGVSQQLQNKEQVQTQLDDLKQSMQQKQQQLNTESEGSGEKVQQMMKNQNQVRVAAQTLSQMEGLLGNKGSQISAIAKEFNNSVQAKINAEEKIQTRSAFSRFFTGGDKGAAEDIEAQVTQNQQQIQELKQLKEETDCDEDVKAMMQEQIQQMEDEQQRLQGLAQKEKNSKGLFGWIWK